MAYAEWGSGAVERPKAFDLENRFFPCSARDRIQILAAAEAAPESVVDLGLALQVLTVELKVASATILRLLALPENGSAAVLASLRSALHHCKEVHAVEVLPSAVAFVTRCGAHPDAWARALSLRARGRVRRHGGRKICAAVASAGGVEDRPPLASAVQEALIRSLDAASALGVLESADLSARLSAQLFAYERLGRRAVAARHKAASSVGATAAAIVGPSPVSAFSSSSSAGDARAPKARGQAEEVRAESSAGRRTWDLTPWSRRLASPPPPAAPPEGPTLSAHAEEIAALLEPPPPPKAPKGASPRQPRLSAITAANCAPKDGPKRPLGSAQGPRRPRPRPLLAASGGAAGAAGAGGARRPATACRR